MESDAPRPIIEPEDIAVLARLVERLALEFDVDDLSTEEAIVLFLLADRAVNAIWLAHRQALLPVFKAAILSDDSDQEEDE